MALQIVLSVLLESSDPRLTPAGCSGIIVRKMSTFVIGQFLILAWSDHGQPKTIMGCMGHLRVDPSEIQVDTRYDTGGPSEYGRGSLTAFLGFGPSLMGPLPWLTPKTRLTVQKCFPKIISID